MLDVHQRNGLSVVANGIDVKGPIIEGDPSLGRTVEVIPSSGVNTLSRRSLTDDNPDLASIEPLMSYLNKDTSINSGIFANYWAQNLIDTINRTEYLSALYAATTLQHDNLFKGNVGRKLSAVSKMMINHEERSVNRDVFYLNLGGFDGHALSKDILQSNLPTVNEGITAFYKEMVHQNLFDNVTFVVMSEFGRTITPNSGLGSDHAVSTLGMPIIVQFCVFVSQVVLRCPHSTSLKRSGEGIRLSLVARWMVAKSLGTIQNPLITLIPPIWGVGDSYQQYHGKVSGMELQTGLA